MSISFYALKDDSFHMMHRVNVSNENGRRILALLGLGLEGYGSMQGEKAHETLRRIVYLLNTELDDSGTETEVDFGDGPMLIRPGQRPGYLRDRLEALQALFKAAIDEELTIQWS